MVWTAVLGQLVLLGPRDFPAGEANGAPEARGAARAAKGRRAWPDRQGIPETEASGGSQGPKEKL